jgi:type IV secretory pathway VirB4 component
VIGSSRRATPPPRRLAQPPLLPRIRARALPAQRLGHRVSSAHLQAAYPFVAEGGLGSRGVYIGRDLHGGSFVYDPWELYGRELTDPNLVVVGHVGSAKSSLVKTLIFRQHVFGRIARVIDVKREYTPLAHAIGGTVIALRPGGQIRLNPLTPLAGPERQLELLRAVTIATLRRRLTPEEDAALRVALHAATTHVAEGAEVTLPDVVSALLQPTAEMADALVTTPEALARAARDTALALARLCEGDLHGMFDGPTTTGIAFDAPLVVLDLADVYSSEALAIFMACATAFMQATLDAHRHTRSQRSSVKVISVVDEARRVLSELGLGEWLQSSFKLARQHGQQNIIVMHRFSDLSAAGAAGSREARLAEGLLSDAGTRVIYRQNESEAPTAAEITGLTETEAALLPGLGRGEAIWKVGPRSFFIHHLISAREAQLVDTDAAMVLPTTAQPVQ